MNNLSKWRKIIRAKGFKVSIRAHRLGTSATYTHIGSRQELKFNVFTPELLERWKPLLDLIKENGALIDHIREESGAFGLKG
jgi:hypothetical protein